MVEEKIEEDTEEDDSIKKVSVKQWVFSLRKTATFVEQILSFRNQIKKYTRLVKYGLSLPGFSKWWKIKFKFKKN